MCGAAVIAGRLNGFRARVRQLSRTRVFRSARESIDRPARGWKGRWRAVKGLCWGIIEEEGGEREKRKERRKKEGAQRTANVVDDDGNGYGGAGRGAVREVVGKGVREARFNTRTSQQLVLHQMVLHTVAIVLPTYLRGCMGASVSPSARDPSRCVALVHAHTRVRTSISRPIWSESARQRGIPPILFDARLC